MLSSRLWCLYILLWVEALFSQYLICSVFRKMCSTLLHMFLKPVGVKHRADVLVIVVELFLMVLSWNYQITFLQINNGYWFLMKIVLVNLTYPVCYLAYLNRTFTLYLLPVNSEYVKIIWSNPITKVKNESSCSQSFHVVC